MRLQSPRYVRVEHSVRCYLRPVQRAAVRDAGNSVYSRLSCRAAGMLRRPGAISGLGDEADSRTMSSQKKACNYRAHRCNSHLQNCIDTVQLNLLIIDSQSKLTINQAQTKTKPSSHQSNQEIIKSYQGVRSLKPAI